MQQKRVVMDATRISDGNPVMLKLLPPTEGPYELQINRLVSTEPLLSDPRNHCAPLLDVVELPNEPKIMVHARLRPFNDPPMQTYGEFVAFFSQLCEVSDNPVVERSVLVLNWIGNTIFASKQHRASVHLLFSPWSSFAFLMQLDPAIVRGQTLC
jgi:hypothetical protein